MPKAMIDGLHDLGWRFYTFIGEGGVRLMCSWDTTDQDIDDFLGDVRTLARTI
jgi:threonine aldolase